MAVRWPDARMPELLQTILQHGDFPGREYLPQPWLAQWHEVWAPLAALIAQRKISQGDFVIGIHGGQGSGKSTLSQALAALYRAAFHWNVVVLSIDDLYLPHAERIQLSQHAHPLLKTRGVPGTHDAALGIDLLRRLRALGPGESLNFPAFDKASDDRLSENRWHRVNGPVDLVLFEGWCVGCRPVGEQQLMAPINALEANEDPDGRWRQQVNAHLAGDYADWFAAIDCLLMLRVPGMEAVSQWRGQQELANKQSAGSHGPDRSLDQAALQRFIQHYQRLTEQALAAMPGWADIVLNLNERHQVDAIHVLHTGGN